MTISISDPMKSFLSKNTHETDETCSKHGCPIIIFDKHSPHKICPLCEKESMDAKKDMEAEMYTYKLNQKRLIDFCTIYYKYFDAEKAYIKAYDYHGRSTKSKVEKLLADDESKPVIDKYARQVLKNDSILTDYTLKNATFDTFDVTNNEQDCALEKSKQLVKQYMDSDGPMNTLFTGLAGRGKSHLALSMLKAINNHSDNPMTCLFISTDELFRQIKDSFNDPSVTTTEENMVRLLTSVDLLVLDDLGSESSMKKGTTEASEFVQKVLFGIFNARTRTIITTNLNAKQMSLIYNYKLVSRIMRGVKGNIIKFTDATDDQRMVDF